MALVGSPHPGAMSGRQLLFRKNALLGAALWPGFYSSAVRAVCYCEQDHDLKQESR